MWMAPQDQGLGRREGDSGSSTPALHFAILLLTLCSAEEQGPILKPLFFTPGQLFPDPCELQWK